MNFKKLYMNGKWVDAHSDQWIDVENPWTFETIAQVPRANHTDVNTAVQAAKEAFPIWSAYSLKERIALVKKALACFKEHRLTLIDLEIAELGQPRTFTTNMHVDRNFDRIDSFITLAENFELETPLATGKIVREPIGVAGLLTPWNYPLGQAVQKITPALLAGNTVVFKPSQYTPLSAYYLADAFDKAGLPAGVFNLVTGCGSEVGDALCIHPDVDMISFTGSTESGRTVGRQALSTIKKIALELGGKSPLLCLPGAHYADAAKACTNSCFCNSGQTCVAFTRIIVPEQDKEVAYQELTKAAQNWHAGDPNDPSSTLGPIVSARQYKKVCEHCQQAIDDGANLLVGTLPDVNAKNRLVQPIIFTDVSPNMAIAKEEVFGPVLVVQTYQEVDEGLALANDTTFGLGGAVFGPSEEAVQAARQIKAGQVFVNNGKRDIFAPFGGYKESGLGREGGLLGLEEYFETKAIFADELI